MKISRVLVEMILKQYHLGTREQYIVIFGAGQNGVLLNKYLQNNGVAVKYFCDTNPEKQGITIDGVLCISFEELCKYKDEVIVFVSPNNATDIYKILKDNGFSQVVSSDEMKLIRFVPDSETESYFQKMPYIGHFYSLYPKIDDILKNEERIFNSQKEVLDIDFNEGNQLALLNKMIELYSSIPKWTDMSIELGSTPLRYRYGNQSLSAGDAIGLHCMLRILKPKRMIEVGSGFTSAVTLDTNEYYLDNQIKLTFIEPYPKLLKSILKETDKIHLIESGLQEVPLEVFDQLESGDILFIDSTHVSKIDSDVNFLFFEIMPRLKEGVYIHLHDIFYPFEYPKQWIHDGVIWNELYLLRAFLQNNSNYSIVFFQNMIEQKYKNAYMEKWPLDVPNHGGSIWLKKEHIK
ncbi:class I SAM-dependent methyltransferase [Brevibacillus sp. 179-C9.3 HS]|uniref:class I SAM-dependent methyltransferase n=1 Tax=unclassified Brevibacillus TaxID=2684853 RepID=UPI00399F241C